MAIKRFYLIILLVPIVLFMLVAIWGFVSVDCGSEAFFENEIECEDRILAIPVHAGLAIIGTVVLLNYVLAWQDRNQRADVGAMTVLGLGLLVILLAFLGVFPFEGSWPGRPSCTAPLTSCYQSN